MPGMLSGTQSINVRNKHRVAIINQINNAHYLILSLMFWVRIIRKGPHAGSSPSPPNSFQHAERRSDSPFGFSIFSNFGCSPKCRKKKGGCQEWCLMICTAWCFSKGWNLSSLPISTSACMQDWFGYDPVQRTGGTPGGGL